MTRSVTASGAALAKGAISQNCLTSATGKLIYAPRTIRHAIHFPDRCPHERPATSLPPRCDASPEHDPRHLREPHRRIAPGAGHVAAAGRLAGIARHAGDRRALRVGNRGARRAGREIYAKRRFTVARQPDAVRGQAATAVGRSVLARLGRGAVPRGRHHAAHRAAPENLARARRRGARQSVLRGQHADPRELRRGVLPAGRLGVRHHRLHVFVDGQGRVDLRHQPRDERLRRRAGDPPSRSKARWPNSRAPPTCR